MQKHEFDGPAGLEEVANSLARASRHPVFADLSEQYSNHNDHDLSPPSQRCSIDPSETITASASPSVEFSGSSWTAQYPGISRCV